jgi:hypothetical protein
MKYQYKTVSIRSERTLKQVERLVMLGWRIISIGFETLILEKII